MDAVVELGSPKMTTNKAIFTLDTHAMAYKLLQSRDPEEDQEEISCSERVSDYGKEARMDFYQNRSRSDGASAIMKSCLKEMRLRKAEDSQDDEEDDEDEEEEKEDKQEKPEEFTERSRRRSSSSTFEARRKFSEPSKLFEIAKTTGPEPEPELDLKPEPDEPRLEMPKRGPIKFIPAVDSSSDLVSLDLPNNRQQLFSENRFVPYFTLPSPAYIMHCLVDERKICLESMDTSVTNQIKCSVLIKRSPQAHCDDRHRRVYARRTLDDWTSSQDVMADFLEPCRQRMNADRFVLKMEFGKGVVKVGSRMEFALAYEIRGEDGRMVSFWDNNGSANYAFWYSA